MRLGPEGDREDPRAAEGPFIDDGGAIWPVPGLRDVRQAHVASPRAGLGPSLRDWNTGRLLLVGHNWPDEKLRGVKSLVDRFPKKTWSANAAT